MKTLSLIFTFIALLSLGGFAQDNDTLTTPSGLKYFYTQHGDGEETKDGWVIIAHYIGSFPDGKVFDSSRDRDEPFAFSLNESQVIKGMDEGVSLLKIGDRAVFIMPPELAYGEKGAGKFIPPNSTLVFDVEILDMKENSLYKELADVLFTINPEQKDSSLHIKEMLETYDELKKENFKDVYHGESDLNRLGYEIMDKQPEDAVKIFELNAKAYPESSNVYDSLAEGYMKIGKNKLAIKNYEKSLKLDPDNLNAVEMIAKLKAM